MRANWTFFGLVGLLLTVFLGVPRRFSASLARLEGPLQPFAGLRRVFHVVQRKRLPKLNQAASAAEEFHLRRRLI